MYRSIDRVSMLATVYFLLAGFVLIGAGLAGIRGTAIFVGLLVAVTLGLFALRPRVPPLGRVLGYDVSLLVTHAWVAAAVAAAVTVAALGATPGEMQTLGGLVGMAAMANYFLRPVYYVVYAFAARVVGHTRPEQS